MPQRITTQPKGTKSKSAQDTVQSPSANGLSQGQFSVDDSGQATFRIPLEVPPGIAGLAPKLELAYGHRQPNGLVGVGWSIHGLSAITRIKATYAVDGFNGAVAYDDNDRYALDGQRLINIKGGYGRPGTVYYTERQSWSYVQEVNGGFVVTTKNGEVMEFGTTADSRILAAGGPDVRAWALNAVVDRNGNRVEYSYTQSPTSDGAEGDLGAYYPDTIRYTVRQDTAANRFVKFHYEARPDTVAYYVGGYPIIMSSRLKQITTSIDTADGPKDIRSYTMEYEVSKATRLSRVVSIKELGASSKDAPAFASAKIIWQDTDAPGFNTDEPVSPLDQSGRPGLVQMDVTGSGRTDVVQLWLNNRDRLLHASTYLATPGAEGLRFIFADDSPLDAFPPTRQVFPVDVDGDGRTDLLVAYQDPIDHSLKLAVYVSDGKGFTAASGSPFKTGDAWDPASHVAFFAMDVNGDGRTDLVEAYARDGQLYFRSYLSQFGQGAGFSPGIVSSTQDPAHPPDVSAFWAMDVNGDGMMDLVRVWRGSDSSVHITAYVSVSTAIDQVSFLSQIDTNLGAFDLAGHAFVPVDVNGDGIQDLLHVWQDPGQTTLHLTTFLCNAAGGFVAGPDTSFPNQTIDLNRLYPMGLNGGGQAALVSPWTDSDGRLNFTILLGSPSGSFRLLPPGPSIAAPPDSLFYPGDPDGNGKADLIQVSMDRDNIPQLVPYLSVGPYNDVASSITNFLGGVVSLQYAPLSDSAVYEALGEASFPSAAGRRYPNPLTPTQFPAQAVLGQAIYVVRSFSRSEDPEVNRFPYRFSSSLNYSNAQINLLGRRWQGFQKVRTTSLESGRVTIQTYNQEFPYTGTLAETRTEADGRYSSDPRVPKDRTVLMRVVSTSYHAYPRGTGAASGQQVVEVLPTSTRRAEFDYGADHFDFALAQTFDHDEYGNLNRRINLGYVNRTSDQPLHPDEVVYRYNLYQNDILPAGGWALGFLRYAKVSANASDPDVTRFLPGDIHLEQRGYTASTYNLASREQWDDANNVYLRTSYEYDSFGNRITETVPGGFITRYDYDPDYHTFPMNVTSPKNNQGASLVTSYGYDPRFGVEVARRDSSGSVFVKALDGFGREIALQGPIPDFSGAVGDSNALTPLVTGSPELRQRFLKAPTVTVETTAYLDDGQGGHYTEVQSLQRFPDGPQREFVWIRSFVDGLAMEREVIHQSGQRSGNVVVLTNYNGDGNPVLHSLPSFSPTAIISDPPHAILTTYDVLGRALERREPAGADGDSFSADTWVYGAKGQVTVTQAAGSDVAYTQIQEHHFYDSHDKVRRTIVPSDGHATTVFQFDRIGRLVRATDPPTASNPDGVTNATTYDSLNRRLTIDNPDQNTTGNPDIVAAKYEYDSVTGRLKRQTDAALQTIVYSYDELGRITGQALSDGTTITFVYDEGTAESRGHMTRVTIQNPDQTVQSQRDLNYDRYGNNSQTAVAIAGAPSPFVINSTFDPQRRIVQEKLPDESSIVRQYAFGKLVNLCLGDAKAAYPLDHYHPTGRPGRLIYGQGDVGGGCITADYTFNPGGRVYHEIVANGSGNVIDDSYQYDLLGQILRIGPDGSSGPSQNFTYVNQRLVAATTPGFAPAAYEYDASGNLLVKEKAHYDFRAHFAVSGATNGNKVYAATPDACGRTQTRTMNGTAQSFEYDGLGFLRRVASSSGETVSEMINDQQGRRLRKTDADGTTTFYITPAYELMRAADGSFSVTRYLRDDQAPVAVITGGVGAKTRYLRCDHKESITHLFDTDGSVASIIGYGGYGEFVLLSGPQYAGTKYESRPWDDAPRLYYFGARYYDPVSGRFLTPDTQAGGSSLLQAGALNRYAFELNNPIRYIDPTGHWASWKWGVLIGVGLIAVGIALIPLAPLVLAGTIGVGLAGIAAGALGGAGIAAGATSISYSATHENHSFSWKDWGSATAISAGVGFVAGGAFAGVAIGGSAAATAVSSWGWAAELGIDAIGSGGISSAADVTSTLFTNLAEGKRADRGLATAAVFGFGFGFAGGAVGFGAGRLATGIADELTWGWPKARRPINAVTFAQKADRFLGINTNSVDIFIKGHPALRISQALIAFSTKLPEKYLENRYVDFVRGF